MIVKLHVDPVDAGRWPDVVEAFGPRASRADSCWCQRFRDPSGSTNREALHHEVCVSTIPIGLLAYLEDRPVGWTRVVPRSTLPGVIRNRALRRIVEDDDSA